MGEKSVSKTNETKASNDEGPCHPRAKSSDGAEKKLDPVKHMESAKSPKCPDVSTSTGSRSNVVSLLSVAEKTIRELYETISKKISNFLANDLRNLKNLSKDELAKLNASLFEYKNEIEKLSQEKIKRIDEMRHELQTRLVTAEEVRTFVKYMDERIATIKGATENVINTLRSNEAANHFVKDLQASVTDYGKKITSAMVELYNALKEKAETLGQSVMDKKKLTTKIQKMPPTLDLHRMPLILRKMFNRMGTGATATSDNESGTMTKKVSTLTRFRTKLPALGLSKHFNSETISGRANVAKATYAGILLYFLYWKMKKSRS